MRLRLGNVSDLPTGLRALLGGALALLAACAVVLALSTAPAPDAAAASHQTSKSVPTARATPVIRCRIDRTDVSWGR